MKRYHAQPANQAGIIRQLLLILFILVAVMVVGRVHASADHKKPDIPEITAGVNGYCLDDYHDSTAVNALVDTWKCNGSAAQAWSVHGAAIEHQAGGCLSALTSPVNTDDPVVMNPCNGSPSQQWVVDIGGFENAANGLCLTMPNTKTDVQLDLSTCNNLSDFSEAWTAAWWDGQQSPVSDVPCNSPNEGQRVACYAERQWNAWQYDPGIHETLLNDYTDGNPSEEWCADFVSYVYQEAGYAFSNGQRDGWDQPDAYDIQYMGFTLHAANGYSPQPGDIAFFNYSGGHVEIVVSGGPDPTFIFGNSGTNDPATGNGEMAENGLTNDGSAGQLIYYLSPN